MGFKKEQIQDEKYALESLIPEVVAIAMSYKERKDIPVIAAGGISTGEDIARFMQLGASAVQMGSIFVTTQECDASQTFKEVYIHSKPEDVLIIESPVGMPGRIIGVRSFARFENKEDDYNEVIINQFIQHSGRPVFSMEAATRHPLQSFADLITIEEYKKTARPKVVMTWAPHPRPLPQAVPNSFAEWMNATDYDFVITHPEGYELAPQFVGNARVEYDQMKAFEGADFVYAKNWAAYAGDNYGQILSKDREWTVSDRQMAVTNNAYFMHCLPVRRNMIVTDDVIESPQSIVIPEAANREISATVVLKRLLESL